MADLPLPEDSFFFREALASADNLDESELEQYDKDPPYELQPSRDPHADSIFTQRLTEAW
jgi:hypothetical protein